MLRTISTLLLAMAVFVVPVMFASAENQENPQESPVVFATWSGLGPDKWASIWLIQRHIAPQARVQFVPYDSRPPDVQLFDIPEATYNRTTDHTTFHQLSKGFDIKSQNIQLLGQIVHDIEINLWLPDEQPQSSSVETAYRALQMHFGRDRVPYACYIAFFDEVDRQLGQASPPMSVSVDVGAIASMCSRDPLKRLDQADRLVPEVPIFELLDMMRAGVDVVFVDVREPDEFAETHVPGALNLPIRDLEDAVVEQLKRAEVVVSYCVKDFRAFEMAKRLQRRGVNAVILNPFGLRGWIATGLPVMRHQSVNDHQATEQLAQCLNRDEACRATF